MLDDMKTFLQEVAKDLIAKYGNDFPTALFGVRRTSPSPNYSANSPTLP